MALFAIKDILPGEEICYDYNFSLFNTDQGQECKCGARSCRGVIGGKGRDFLITLKGDDALTTTQTATLSPVQKVAVATDPTGRHVKHTFRSFSCLWYENEQYRVPVPVLKLIIFLIRAL
jgi:hypothetical protein